jgi:hypothetical protein
MRLYPTSLACGPDPDTGKARFDLTIAGGHTLTILLDIAHSKAISARLDEVVSGRVMARPPSRRVLELALFNEDEVAETMPPLCAVGGTKR